jgi:hypothetical protein
MTYVLIHGVADVGWGFGGKVYAEVLFTDRKPPGLSS